MNYLSDAYIFNLLDTLKSEYFIASSLVLMILGLIAKKTKAQWLSDLLEKAKKIMGRSK